jgi:hypothetical protein
LEIAAFPVELQFRDVSAVRAFVAQRLSAARTR